MTDRSQGAENRAVFAEESKADTDPGLDVRHLLRVLQQRWKLLVFAPLTAGAIALGGSYLIKPTFTARASILSPQQQQSSTAAALASLSALTSLAGASGFKTQADQYVALMQSVTVQDRLIDRFKLMEVYNAEYRFLARRQLLDKSRVVIGKKDGLIYLEVDDSSPQRAAELANAHIEELRRLTDSLSLSEAQQRRKFFEQRMQETRGLLLQAQQALQSSGFNENALRAEPKAAVESYARMKAEVTAAEVRLATLRQGLADSSAPVLQQQAALNALRAGLAGAEAGLGSANREDYVSKFRDYKYQESLFEIFARQFELARLDESREGALIQVVDPAQPPEWKSHPKRAVLAGGAAVIALLLSVLVILVQQLWLQSTQGLRIAAHNGDQR